MAFAASLQTNSRLQLLDLGDTDLKTESVIALATVLNHNPSLLCLNVNNPLLFSQEEETTVHLANMLKVGPDNDATTHGKLWKLADCGGRKMRRGGV